MARRELSREELFALVWGKPTREGLRNSVYRTSRSASYARACKSPSHLADIGRGCNLDRFLGARRCPPFARRLIVVAEKPHGQKRREYYRNRSNNFIEPPYPSW